MRTIALRKTPIKTVAEYYHLNRSVRSVSLAGQDSKKKNYYFIYLPKSKKAYLYDTKNGQSKKKILKIFRENHPNRIVKDINLGWYQKHAVWEVHYTKKTTAKSVSYSIISRTARSYPTLITSSSLIGVLSCIFFLYNREVIL